MQCNAISLKMEKEGKPRRKNPPPKREISTIKKMRDKKTSCEEKTPPIREKKRKIDQVTSYQCTQW